MLWGSTVVTSGPVWALVIYTGSDSRAVLNTSAKRTKIGIFDSEVNTMSKTLFCILMLAAAVLVGLKGLSGIWVIYFARFVLLLSSIIPISLRVNLDLAKTYYSRLIATDAKMDSTVVRNSSMPEELGRIDVLLTDKTGTLTKNDMVLKKLHIGRTCFTSDCAPDIRYLLRGFAALDSAYHLLWIAVLLFVSSIADINSSFFQFKFSGMSDPGFQTGGSDLLIDGSATASCVGQHQSFIPSRRFSDVWDKLRMTLIGLGVCHNVTPIQDELSGKVLPLFCSSKC